MFRGYYANGQSARRTTGSDSRCTARPLRRFPEHNGVRAQTNQQRDHRIGHPVHIGHDVMTQGCSLDARKRRVRSADELSAHAPDKGGHRPRGAAPVPRECSILSHAVHTLDRRDHGLTA